MTKPARDLNCSTSSSPKNDGFETNAILFPPSLSVPHQCQWRLNFNSVNPRISNSTLIFWHFIIKPFLPEPHAKGAELEPNRHRECHCSSYRIVHLRRYYARAKRQSSWRMPTNGSASNQNSRFNTDLGPSRIILMSTRPTPAHTAVPSFSVRSWNEPLSKSRVTLLISPIPKTIRH